jgi:5-(carboxyamino)imidazole ribonucleotide mutase
VPMESAALKGIDSLLSTVQMPAGIPVGTLAIGPAGARNAALLAVAILANSRPGAAREVAPVPDGAEREGSARDAAVALTVPGQPTD